jgi:hypothetical protein
MFLCCPWQRHEYPMLPEISKRFPTHVLRRLIVIIKTYFMEILLLFSISLCKANIILGTLCKIKALIPQAEIHCVEINRLYKHCIIPQSGPYAGGINTFAAICKTLRQLILTIKPVYTARDYERAASSVKSCWPRKTSRYSECGK